MPDSRMPSYECHKTVSALKIVEVAQREPGVVELHVTPPFAPIVVDLDWVEKHDPQAGGYYVVYKDGYASFSPAEAFEEGYSLTPVAGIRRVNPVNDLVNRFTYHAPHGDQQDRYLGLRTQGLVLAERMEWSCPDSRERSLALTKLEESIMWANASIARNEPRPMPAEGNELRPAEEPS